MSAADVNSRSKHVASMYTSGRAELMTADEVMAIPGHNDRQQIGKRDREEDIDINVTNPISNTTTANPTTIETTTSIEAANNPKPTLKLTLPKRLLKAVSNDTTKMDVDDNTQSSA